MTKVEGYFDILAVGGVTAGNDGNTIAATQDNVSQHFPQPRPYEQAGPELPDDGFPKETDNTTEHGFETEDPANDPDFIAASEYARAHGLTAVLAQERNDVGPDGVEQGFATMEWISPQIIYLDQSGNQVSPEDAPQMKTGFEGLLEDQKTWGGGTNTDPSDKLLPADPSIMERLKEAAEELFSEWAGNAYPEGIKTAQPYTAPASIAAALADDRSVNIADLNATITPPPMA